MIRCITFDWGDTLAANWGMPSRFILRRELERLGRALGAEGDWVQASFDEVTEAMRRSVDPVLNPEHREFDLPAMIEAWVRRQGRDPKQHAPTISAFGRGITSCVTSFGGVRETFRGLKARGLRLGIVSHVAWPAEACRDWFAREGLAEYLDFYSLSAEVGWIKPSPHHYQDAISRSGVAAHEIMHVGDHPWRDVAGARAAGMHNCLRMTQSIYPAEELAACAPDMVVAHVRELLEADLARLDGLVKHQHPVCLGKSDP